MRSPWSLPLPPARRPPDGAEVWVGSNETGAVTVISTASGAVSHTLTGATFPYRLGASPDGTRIAVVDRQADQLRIADVATHAWVGSIPLAAPRGVIIAADSRTAWAPASGGSQGVVRSPAAGYLAGAFEKSYRKMPKPVPAAWPERAIWKAM